MIYSDIVHARSMLTSNSTHWLNHLSQYVSQNNSSLFDLVVAQVNSRLKSVNDQGHERIRISFQYQSHTMIRIVPDHIQLLY